jgi:hypothetical protein
LWRHCEKGENAVKKIVIYVLAAVLLYGFFRDLDAVKALLIGLGLGGVYAVSRLPGRYIVAMKYPIILLSFAATAAFFFFPHEVTKYPIQAGVIFLSFYSITFYLITMDEKKQGLFKETVALSLLFLSSSFNLAMTGKCLTTVSIAISIMLFLFITGRSRIIPFIAGYTLLVMLLFFKKDAAVFGGGMAMTEVDRYLLMVASFLLLVLGFVGFVKKVNTLKMLAFFGFLYIATDLLLVLGFRLADGLLYQPVVSLLIAGPLLGVMARAEGERL